MLKLIPAVKAALAIISMFIIIAEDALGPSTGPTKRAKVIEDVKAQLPKLAAQLSMPSWLVELLTNEAVLGLLVDLLVAGANAAGSFLKRTAEGNTPDPQTASPAAP